MKKINLSTFRVVISALLSAWAFRIISAISGIIALPLVVLHLGKAEFGIWVLIGQAISFFSLSDFGTASAIGRFLARVRGQKDADAADRLFSTAFLIMFLAGLIVAVLTVLVAPWIPGLLSIPSGYAELAGIIFIITGFSLALQFPLRLGMGILTGYQLYGLHAIGKILSSILYLIGVITLATLNSLNLIWLTLVSAGATIISQLVLMFVAWWKTGPWKISLRNVSWHTGKQLFGLGSSLLVITVSKLIYDKGMVIMIGRILGMAAVGIFGVVSTLIDNLAPIFSALSTPFTTLASEWQVSDQTLKLRHISNIVIRVTFSLTASAAAGLFIYGQPILRLLLKHGDWTTSDFSNASGVLALMGLGLAVGLPQSIVRAILQGVGKHWQVSNLNLFASVLSFTFSVLAMHFGFSIQGAAFGWSTYWFIQGVVLYPPIISRYLKQPIKEMFIRAYLPGGVVALFVLMLAWSLSLWLVPDNASNLLAGILTCTVLGGVATILISGQTNLLWSRLIKRNV